MFGIPTSKPIMLPTYEIKLQAQSIKKTNINLALHDIPKEWVLTKGKNIKIGILDSGLPHHDDLEGQIVAFKNFTDSPTADDIDGHSTHCTGIIVAHSKTDEGLIGIAPEATVCIGKVLNDVGAGSDEWLANGIYWCIEQGCHLINLSLGAPAKMEKRFPKSRLAVQEAFNKNIYMFAATGNDGGHDSVDIPARWNEVFSISATDLNNARAPFSNSGDEVDFTNVGTDVISTYLENGYAAISGTSQATPGIVGVAALILSEHMNAAIDHDSPINNFWDLRAHLISLTTDIGAAGYDEDFGFGQVVFGKPDSGYDASHMMGGIVPPPAKPLGFWRKVLSFFGLQTIKKG